MSNSATEDFVEMPQRANSSNSWRYRKSTNTTSRLNQRMTGSFVNTSTATAGLVAKSTNSGMFKFTSNIPPRIMAGGESAFGVYAKDDNVGEVDNTQQILRFVHESFCTRSVESAGMEISHQVTFKKLNERRLDLIDKLFSDESLTDFERIELVDLTNAVSIVLRKTLGVGPLNSSMNHMV